MAPTGSARKPDRMLRFTILHTNDLHSSLIGMGPASDYTPQSINDDATRGGFARLATLISARRTAREADGPVLVLDAGDYSMGTAFGAAIRETGGELRLLWQMGYDATTFGNHEFDLGPDGLGQAIDVAAKTGHIPAVVVSNTNFSAEDATLLDLQRLAEAGIVRRHVVIERGGIRFGIFGLLGKEATFYTAGAGAVTFDDAIETAKEMVTFLRETEKVDVVICISHGGVEKGADGSFAHGDDVSLAEAVPGIDVVVGGHSHTALHEAIVVNGRTPVVQAGVNSEYLGELVVTLDGGTTQVESYGLHPIDDSIAGDVAIVETIDKLKETVTRAVFATRGYSIDQPLAVVQADMPNTFTDIPASTPLANLVTDAIRVATKADIGFSANGMLRASLLRGRAGVQTVYDVFALAPLGAGILDPTAGSALVTGYFTGRELKNILEFMLVDNPAHPGEYFPRASGMRFHFDRTRPMFDVVTAIELGDFDSGYHEIDIGEETTQLFSLACPLYLAVIVIAIPTYTKGALPLVAKKSDGQPLESRVEALELPRGNSPYLLPPPGTVDRASLDTSGEGGCLLEIKEWQAIMDHLRNLPGASVDGLPVVPLDARATEVRGIGAV